jgi:hypothetical protein
MRYAIVIERGETSYGAYVPDLRAAWPPPRRARKR